MTDLSTIESINATLIESRSSLADAYRLLENFRDADADKAREALVACESELNKLGESLAKASIRLGVIGESNAGKTAFVNAFSEKPYLADDPLPGASGATVELKRAAATSVSVVYRDGRRTRQTFADENELKDLLQKKTSGREENIREILWESDFATLPPDLVLVDAPGVDSVNPAHTETALAVAAQCDVLLLLTRLNRPLSRDLTRAATGPKPCFIIGTCADEISPQDLEKLREHFKRRISERFGRERRFFFIAALPALEELANPGAGAEALTAFRDFRRVLIAEIRQNGAAIRAARASDSALRIIENLITRVREPLSRIGSRADDASAPRETPAVLLRVAGEKCLSVFREEAVKEEKKIAAAAQDELENLFLEICDAIDACQSVGELNEFIEKRVNALLETRSAKIDARLGKLVASSLNSCLEKASRRYALAAGELAGSGSGAPTRRINIKIRAPIANDDIINADLAWGGGGAAVGALALLLPGVGLVLGGAAAAAGALIGWLFGPGLDELKQNYTARLFDSFRERLPRAQSAALAVYREATRRAEDALKLRVAEIRREGDALASVPLSSTAKARDTKILSEFWAVIERARQIAKTLKKYGANGAGQETVPAP